MVGRRFDDSGFPLEPLEAITDSNWDKLSPVERADLLRQREALMLERHEQLMRGQASIRDRVGSQGAAIKANADATRRIGKRLDDDLGPLLQRNTEATARTEDKVDDLIRKAETLLSFWGDVEGAGGLLNRLGNLAKNVGIPLAWVAVPIAALYGGWKALLAWLHLGSP